MPPSANTLGRYELLAKLASGGMGEIHLARLAGRAGFEKLVVLKRLLPELAPAGEYVTMFFDEARLAARLSHPNVCEVYDLGEDQGQYYIVMQWLEGVPFASVMRRPDGVDERAHERLVTGILRQACEGLHHAHELRDADGRPLGVVHRDVSPSNLMVTADGVVKVLDFGIAKARSAQSVTERGVLKGKLSYMSPEQLAEAPLDRRADVFCLGILAWEALAGRRLFKRDAAVTIAKAVLEDEVPRLADANPAVPPALSDVVMRALARDPAARFATARELGLALERAMAPHGGPMSTVEIAHVVQERFADELERQRALYRRSEALPAAPVPPPPASTPTAPARPAAMPAKPSPRALWPALAVVLAAAAVGLVLWRPWRSASAPAREPHATATPPAPDAAPAPTPPPAAAPPPDAGAMPPPPERPPPRPAKPTTPGRVSIDSRPYAIIYLGKKRLGETPIISEALPPGRHTLRAVLPDGRSRRFTVDVPPGGEAPPVHLTW
jgi:serine/threonine-protein kinase